MLATMDRIEITGLRTFGRHGVFAWEHEQGQDFTVDLTLEVDLAPAAAADDLAQTVDYGMLSEQVATLVEETRFDLIESLASRIADLVLEDERVHAVDVRVGKPEVALPVELRDVAVRLRRERPAR